METLSAKVKLNSLNFCATTAVRMRLVAVYSATVTVPFQNKLVRLKNMAWVPGGIR